MGVVAVGNGEHECNVTYLSSSLIAIHEALSVGFSNT